MLFPSKKDALLGVDIGSHYVKIAQLNLLKGGYELAAFGMHQLEPDTIVGENIEKPEVIVEAIKTILSTEKIKAKSAATAVQGRAAVIKKIALPRVSEYDIGELLRIESEQYIPFDISEASLDYYLVSEESQQEEAEEEEGKQREVLLVAVQREKVDLYKNLISQAGLNPVVVDVDVFAIENGYELSYGVDENAVIALVDVGAGVTGVNILEKGLTTFVRDVNYAGDMITYAIRDELDVGFELAEQLKRGTEVEGFSPIKVGGILSHSLGELCGELRRVFDQFKEAAERDVDRISLSGGSARIKGIDRFMQEKLGIPVEIANPFKNVKVNDKVFDPEFIEYASPMAAVAVGLATRKFDDKEVESKSKGGKDKAKEKRKGESE